MLNFLLLLGLYEIVVRTIATPFSLSLLTWVTRLVKCICPDRATGVPRRWVKGPFWVFKNIFY
jgi:hypothetical protein